MKRYQRTALPQYIYVLLLLLIVVGVGFLSKTIMESFSFVDHFGLPWAASRTWLLEGRNPYEPSVRNYASRMISESGFLAVLPDIETLQQPMINLILYLPFSLLPYGLARIIWMILLLSSIVITCILSLRLIGWKITPFEKVGMISLSLLWLPSLFGTLTGQLTLFVNLFSILCVFLIASGKDTAAGFLMALMIGSLPQSIFFLIFLVIWVISTRRWSVLTAFISGTAFQFVVTVLLLPSWLINWLTSIFDVVGGSDWVQTPLMRLALLLPGIEEILIIVLHVAFGAFMLFLWITSARKSGRVLIWNAAAILVLTFLLHIQVNITLLVALMMGLLLVFHFWEERWGVIGKVISWVTLFLISAVSWLPLIRGGDFTQDISLPFLTYGLPLLVLLALLWIRWWVVKIPRLNDEI